MLIDSHCHLDFPDFATDLDGVVGRAGEAGVTHIVSISTRVRRLAGLLAIAERFPSGHQPAARLVARCNVHAE